MKLWKKCLAAGMTAAMVLALGACGGDNGQDEGQSQASGSDKTITVGSSNFTEAFVSTSLVFCIGAMAIVGSIEDGLNHDYTMLFTKAVMDGVLSIVFVASLGIGAAFSMFPVGIYQGSITLLAGLVKPYLTDLMIGRLSCIGSILIFALGLNLTIGTKIKIANMLPAVFLPVIVCLLGF